jgi:hypothetical protein
MRAIGWPAFWLTVSGGLAAVVAWQLTNGLPLAPTVTAAPPGAPPLEVAEQSAPPRPPAAAAVEQIAARPLFSDTRRPYQPPPEPVAAAAAPEPAELALPLELAGTFLTGTDQAALLLVSGGTPAWLRKGQLIDGWRIEAIAQDQVQLRKGGRLQVLRLRDDLVVVKSAEPRARQQEDSEDAAAGEAETEPADADAETPE